jgi:hypothetical protein
MLTPEPTVQVVAEAADGDECSRRSTATGRTWC